MFAFDPLSSSLILKRLYSELSKTKTFLQPFEEICLDSSEPIEPPAPVIKTFSNFSSNLE